MPKKKTIPADEVQQNVGELPEQTDPGQPETEMLPQDMNIPDEGLPIEAQNGEGDPFAPDGADAGTTEALTFDAPQSAPENGPGAVPMEPQGPDLPDDTPLEDLPLGDQATAPAEDALPIPEPVPVEEVPPMTDRQNFFALDFRELDRGLTPEERQAWNSIYASYRGRSALSGKIIGADPHSMNVRDRETGKVERRTMYCVVVLLYRVPVYIPATEMWSGEARPDYVLQNMMGADIDFIITKVDREGGYAIASRRQAARAQRYFFAHRPDLCRTGARVKCRMLSVGPRRCLVECYGHDIGLTQRELSYTAIADLREKYHPGDELDCIVKSYNAAQRELNISVKETESNPFEGAELRHPVGSRRFAVIAGKYGGGVFCNLPDGTVCMCNYSYQHEDSDFQAGDNVMLVVQRFEQGKQQMYGKILSKW